MTKNNLGNIRILCIDHEGGFGGSSRSLYYLLQGINKKKVSFEVWYGKSGPIQEMYKNIEISSSLCKILPTSTTVFMLSRNLISILKSLIVILINYKTLLGMAKKINEKFDLVHFNHPNLYLLSIIFGFYVKKPFTFHMRTKLEDLYEGTPNFFLSNKINSITSKWFASIQVSGISRIADAIIFITNSEKQSFLKLGGKALGYVIHNTVSDTEHYTPHPQLVNEKRFKIASIENYRWSRGTDRLIEIACSLKKMNRDDIAFIVAGDMTLPKNLTGELGKIAQKGISLKEYIFKIGLGSYFIFLGHVNEPEGVILGCDVLVSLTRRVGPWGRSVIEAMKMGKPVISVGTQQGFVINEETGIFSYDFDPDNLAEEIVNLKTKKNLYQKYSIASKKHINILCDQQINSDKILGIWQGLIQSFEKSG